MNPIEFLKKQKKGQNSRDIAKISNALVEALIQNNNLTALKVIFYIAKTNIDVIKDSELIHITIDTKKLCEYCGIDTKTLRRNVNKMQETNISFVQENIYEEHIIILPYIKFSYSGTIEVKIFLKVLNLIREVKNRFTTIDVKNLMKFKSKHSIRMILLLEMISGFSANVAKRKHYNLDELNGMFGTNYSRLKEFERKILVPVQKELNEKSKLSFLYELKFDKEDITARGRPKAVGVIIDLYRKERTKKEGDRAFLDWVAKIRKEHVNEILFYHPQAEANLRVSSKGNLYLDNGDELKASKAKEFWRWMYENQGELRGFR